MKKLFFFAAAALAMLASCQKTEINESPSQTIDDSKPVAMQFNVNAPSFEVTKTKAAVNAWAETKINVFGLENSKEGYVKLIDNYETTVVDATTPLEIYQTGTTPYYYAENKLYDFFGYHLGGAEATVAAVYDEEGLLKDNTVEFDVTFTGSEDIMYATTNKDEDILKDLTAQVTTEDIYSAWAARRNVQPTLVFEHALTRFNFYVKGMNKKSANVTIKKISAQSVDKGSLTVVSKNALGFVPEAFDEKTAPYLDLKTADDKEFVKTKVVPGETFVAGGEGASLMLAPEMEALNIKVEMENNEHPEVTIPNYEFQALASQVRKTGLAENAGIDTFAAGTAYNIYINVYGPEEIIITAELTPWAIGGDFTYDPDDQRPNGKPSTYVTAQLTSASATTLAYDITTSDDVVGMRAKLVAKNDPDNDKDYKPVTLTTKALGGNVEFTGLTENEVYTLVVEYKTDVADDYTPAEKVEVTAPATSTTVTKAGYVFNEASFNEYCSDKLTWYPESTPQSLPWLAVKLENAVQHVNVVVSHEYEGKKFTKEFNWESENITLVTISEDEKELGHKLTPGTWYVTVNGVESTIEVPVEFEVTKTGIVTDENSFNELCAEKLTWYPESTPQTLPWLVAHFTATTHIDVTATCGSYTKNIAFDETEEFSMLTLNAEELGTEIKDGDIWYVTINGVTVKYEVPADVKANYVVYDETTYNKLPEGYRTAYGEWGTPGLEESLPWLVIELNTPVKRANWTASFDSKVVKSGSWTKPDGSEISLVTINAKELGTEIVAGEWTVTINGTTVTFDVIK